MKSEKSPFQDLFDRVLKEGRKEKDQEYENDRQRDGSYVRGFSNFTTISVLEANGFRVQATQVDWQTLNLSSDKNGVRYALKVLMGEEVVLEATREGASTSKNFGPEERYIDTTETPEGNWKILHGELPKELEVVPV